MAQNKPLKTILTPLGYVGITLYPIDRVKRELNASGDVL